MATSQRGEPERGELSRATAEANEIFTKMRQLVQEAVEKGETELNVAEVARNAGLEIEERDIDELKIDRIIYVLPWLGWHQWWPHRPLWCWWWRKYYWWYPCCRWWWYRCHWFPGLE